MKRRVVTCLALAFGVVVAYVAARWAAGSDPTRIRILYASFTSGAELLALVGCAAAALTLDRGDFLRSGWLLQGASFACLAFSNLCRTLGEDNTTATMGTVMTLLINVLT